MEELVEYLTEWPPKMVSIGQKETSPENMPPSKRPKHDCRTVSKNRTGLVQEEMHQPGMGMELLEEDSEELYHVLSPEETNLVKGATSLKADALLARWWKMQTKGDRPIDQDYDQLEAHCDSDTIHKLRVLSSVPQTQLFHIAR